MTCLMYHDNILQQEDLNTLASRDMMGANDHALRSMTAGLGAIVKGLLQPPGRAHHNQ